MGFYGENGPNQTPYATGGKEGQPVKAMGHMDPTVYKSRRRR
jgi:hypothetical protein